MKTLEPRKRANGFTSARSIGWLGAAMVVMTVSSSWNPLFAQSLETKDKVANRVGVFRGGSVFSSDGLGHTGSAGDSAADFGAAGSGPVYVQDATFFNEASPNNELTVAFWAKDYNISDSSGFWVNTAVTGGKRGFQAHIPWSNNNIYFDSSGCCGADTRINADIATFPNYTGDPSWWAEWHFFVFSKKGDDKQIWIDGTQFLAGSGTAPLASDFTDLYIGSDGAGNGLYHGLIDDFMVFKTQLAEADIASLAGGTLPTALPAEAGLLAYWDFNDAPSEGQFGVILPAPDTKSGAPNLVRVVHIDGGLPWDQNTATLKIDGVQVPTTFTKEGAVATYSYVPATPFVSGSQHTAVLTYSSGVQAKTLEWTFTVGLYTTDSVAGRLGSMTGGSAFTAGAGGHSGLAGDYGIDFGPTGSGPIVVSDVSFLNVAAANDEMSFAFWAKKYDTAAGSAFWAVSPSSNNAERGYQAHVPWSDNTIYFDSVGCCGAGQRLNASITSFIDYTGDLSWWQDWHYFVFSKKIDSKQIWIDGKLFLEGTGAAVLPQDFTRLMIGSDNAGGGLFHAVIDDFAVFSTQLTETDIATIVGGAKASALPAEAGLLAYWDFNDIPAEGIFQSLSPAEGATAGAPNLIKVVHLQGPVAWDLSKVSLKVDNTIVDATVALEGGKATVSYVPSPMFAPKSSHSVVLTYPSGATLLTKSWQFQVGAYSKDVLHNYLGLFEGSAVFSEDAGGRTGESGDFAADLGQVQAGQSVHVLDASFLNEATANDELAVAGWQKLHSVHDSAFFWGVSPSSNGGSRGWGTHTPWSNGNLYFDTAGCCVAGEQRLEGAISGFPPYAEVGDATWWNSWHYFVFQKKLSTKEIWIDGQLFLTGENLAPLPTDFTEAFIGADPIDNARLQGIVDDIAVFKTALTPDDITTLAGGAAATSLPASAGLIAFWNFNDGGSPSLRVTAVRDGNTLKLSWAGGAAPYTLERKTSLSDAAWQQVSTGAGTTASLPIDGTTGFFRVISQ